MARIKWHGALQLLCEAPARQQKQTNYFAEWQGAGIKLAGLIGQKIFKKTFDIHLKFVKVMA